MANTTNFGWETPDDTDLVKDGAAAMRTLGNAIDASLVDLKGGTTGQVLSKNTNTDMDFVWTTPQTGDITAVTAGTGLSGGGTSGDVTLTNTVATTFDAKGDLVVGTGADTFAKLVAGSNGDTLVADSSATTGLRWTATPSASNPVINGGFDIWQRNTSVAGSGTAFTADRWQAYRATTGSTFTRQVTGDTTNLPSIQYCLRVARDSGNSATNGIFAFQNLESVNSIPFAGKTVTLSFYARRGANFSATSNNMVAQLVTGTGTDQNYLSGFTNQASLILQNAALTTTWQRFSFSGNVGSTVTQLAISFYFDPTGTAGAADYFEITGVQLDVGSVALPFRRTGGTLAGELAACQRYYWRLATGANQSIGNFNNYSASIMQGIIQFPVSMRGTPTLDSATGTDFYKFVRNGGSDTFNSFTLEFPNTTSTNIYNDSQISGTAGHAGIVSVNNASGYVGFSAEL